MKSGGYALMTAVGGTAGRLIPDSGTAGYAEVVRDKEEMVRVVRRQVKEGADIIKIHVTGSIPTRSGEIQVWTRDELKVVCDTAHDLGVRVTAHCRGDKATLDAVMAGVDIIWHASFLGDAALEAIIDKKVPVGPVFTFLANLSEYGHKAGATSSAKAIFEGELEQTGSKLREAYDAGVKLLCGLEWTWASMRPGMMVSPVASITSAALRSAGSIVSDLPTSAMRPSLRSTSTPACGLAPDPSITVPPVMSTVSTMVS
ncbi:MAG: hypothetical protein EB010_10290 [Acidimicrobiia bacterium]|nr:hypothetical protein [Acidimicrobiia bacterium]